MTRDEFVTAIAKGSARWLAHSDKLKLLKRAHDEDFRRAFAMVVKLVEPEILRAQARRSNKKAEELGLSRMAVRKLNLREATQLAFMDLLEQWEKR